MFSISYQRQNTLQCAVSNKVKDIHLEILQLFIFFIYVDVEHAFNYLN